MDKRNFHEDEKERFRNERHAGIVIKNNKLLLIHRIKDGYEYYVFPGGHKRINELGKNATIREIKEETNIDCKNAKLIFKFNDLFKGKRDYYYLCTWIKGDTPELIGEELIRNSEENFYEPMWVPVEKIRELNILPYFAKYWLLENVDKIE